MRFDRSWNRLLLGTNDRGSDWGWGDEPLGSGSGLVSAVVTRRRVGQPAIYPTRRRIEAHLRRDLDWRGLLLGR